MNEITNSDSFKQSPSHIEEYLYTIVADEFDKIDSFSTRERDIRKKAYEVRKSPAMAIKYGLHLAEREELTEAKKILDKALTYHPDYFALYERYAYYYSNIEWNPILAIEHIKTALSKPLLVKRRASLLYAASLIYRDTSNADEGIKYLSKNSEQLKYFRNLNPESQGFELLYDGLITLCFELQNYALADKYWHEAMNNNSAGADWPKYKQIINLGLNAQSDKSRYYAKNPFLAEWDEKFGNDLSLAIKFANNSSIIPPSATGKLDVAAKALTSPTSNNYVFLIEGHTASPHEERLNPQLSLQRANAIKQYLVNNHGIEAGKLQTAGYGTTHPIAPNDTETGKQRNRRVDIRPFGNITAPVISVAADLDAKGATFSNDGRYMAAGYFPITLWDIKQKVKIRDLYYGGEKRSFSPNGRYIAAISNATDDRGVTINALYLSDIKTGLLEDIITFTGTTQTIKSFSWSPYSNQLAYMTNNGIIKIYDLNKKHTVASQLISNTRISGVLKWLSNGRHIVAGQYQRNWLHVFSAKDLTQVKKEPGLSWPHAIGESSDGSHLIVANNDNTIALYDTKTLSLLKRENSNVPTPKNIIAIPGKKQFVFNDRFRDRVVSVFDYEKMDAIAAKAFDHDPYIGVSANGETIYVASGEKLFSFDIENEQASETIQTNTHKGIGLLIDRDNDYLLSQDTSGTTVWGIKTGRRIHSIDKVNLLPWLKSATENIFLSVSEAGELLTFNTDNFSLRKDSGIKFEPTNIYRKGNYFVISGRDKGTHLASTGTDYVAVFDASTMSRICSFRVDIVNQPLLYNLRSGGIEDIAISPETETIAITTRWNDGGRGNTHSQKIQFFDLTTGINKGTALTRLGAEKITFKGMKNGEIRVYSGTNAFTVNLETGKHSNWGKRNYETTALNHGAPIQWDAFLINRGDLSIIPKEHIISLIANEKRNLLLAQTKSNKLIYYSLNTLEPFLTVNIQKNNQWLAYTPNGYFTSSTNGSDNAFLSFGDRFIPLNGMKERYENPLVIEKTLKQLFSGKHPLLFGAAIERDVLEPPFTVEIMGKKSIQTTDPTHTIKLRVDKQNKNSPDPRFVFTVNGRKTRGFEAAPFYDGNEVINISREIPLGIGQNNVEVSLVYRGISAHTETIEITRNPELASAGIKENSLWFFGVGISEYQKALQNLDFAHRDAIELANELKKQEGKLFANVHTKVLVNKEATARNVKDQMNEFLLQATANDIVVIFIAGHGIQDTDQTLYFMAHDGDLQRPYTGLPVSDFRAFLEQRPINQKTLFLLDICHAGTINEKTTSNGKRGRLTSEHAIKQLSEGTATTVRASSTGAQQSFEDESFGGGHGAFTYSILEALKGKGDSEMGDQDGYTSLLEMIFYTIREVPRITNRAQKPTLPMMIDFEDYPIAKVM